MTLAFDEPRIQEVVGSLSRKMLINGEWVDAASGKTFDTLNPATGEVLADVADGDAEDIDRAVSAARRGVRGRPVAQDDRRPSAAGSSGSSAT